MKKLNGARWLLVTLLVVDILIAGLGLMHRQFGAIFLDIIRMLPPAASQPVEWFVEHNLLIFANLIWLLIVGIAIVGWMDAAYDLVQNDLPEAAPVHGEWTLTGWLIPIINFYKPYQLLRELYRCGNPAASSMPLHALPSSSGLLFWWLLYRPAHFVYLALAGAVIFFFVTGIVLIPVVDIQQQIMTMLAISVVTSIAWLSVVNMLTGRLLYAASQNERVIDESAYFSTIYRREPQIDPIAAPNTPLSRLPAQSFKPAITMTGMSHAETAGTPFIEGTETRKEIAPVHTMGDPSFDESAAYTRIAEEMDTKQWEKGTWLKALVESGNDPVKQPLLYAKLRLVQLHTEHVRKQAETQEQQEKEERQRIEMEEAAQRRREAEHFLMGQFHAHSAATLSEAEFLEVIQLAIAENRVNQRSRSNGKTLLHMAIERLEMIERDGGSREAGDSVTQADEKRRTLRAIQQLLNAGADTTLRDRSGQSSHDYARTLGIHLKMLQ